MLDIQAITDVNNLMGCLVYELAFGDVRKKLDQFLIRGDNVSLNINGQTVYGRNTIKRRLEELEQRGLLGGNYHLLHSNAYKMDGDGKVIGHWNTYSYFIGRNNRTPVSVSFGYLRFRTVFQKEDRQWKIEELECDELITFEPEQHHTWKLPALLDVGGPEIKAPDNMQMDGRNYTLLRNLTGSFIQNGPGEAKKYFSENRFETFFFPCVYPNKITDYAELMRMFDLFDEKERAEDLYHYLMTATTPVLTLSDECHGSGVFLSQILTFERAADGHTYFRHQLGRMNLKFIKENHCWRIQSLNMEILLKNVLQEFKIPADRPMAMLNPVKWLKAPEQNGMITETDVEAFFETESFLPQWTERLKRGDNENFIRDYMNNHYEEISFSLASGKTVGYDKAVKSQTDSHEKFNKGSMALRFPQFHTGNAPVFSVSQDRRYIQISWMEWGWGNIGYGIVFDESEKNRTYTPMIGQYNHKFVRDDGMWKLYSFGWKPLLQGLPSWSYNTDRVRGWASKPYRDPWPLPFETMKK